MTRSTPAACWRSAWTTVPTSPATMTPRSWASVTRKSGAGPSALATSLTLGWAQMMSSSWRPLSWEKPISSPPRPEISTPLVDVSGAGEVVDAVAHEQVGEELAVLVGDQPGQLGAGHPALFDARCTWPAR